MTEEILEHRAGNGSEAQGKPVRKCIQLSKIRASKDCRAGSICKEQEGINSADIWRKRYSKMNSSPVDGENRGTVSNSGGRMKAPEKGDQIFASSKSLWPASWEDWAFP